MHLLTVLAAGVQDAPRGQARLYRRGTSTTVQWWRDFEGLVPQAPGSEIRLDDYGRAKVYVGELTDVSVLDEEGTEVFRYTDGPQSSAIEVRSQAFTGRHYETAHQGANEPLTLTSLLDAWLVSAGAVDWNVDMAGEVMTIMAALGPLVGLVHNVKAEPYNAYGDGVTDDSAAVQDALTSAENNGGGVVYFPRGIYLLNDAITVPAGVSVLGAGADFSEIRLGYTTGVAMTVTGAGASGVKPLVYGLTFRCVGVSIAPMITGSNAKVINCAFYAADNDSPDLITLVGAYDQCRFYFGHPTATVVNGASDLSHCHFTYSGLGTFTGNLLERPAMVFRTSFGLSSIAAGTYTVIWLDGSSSVVEDCYFSLHASLGATIIDLGTIEPSQIFREQRNRISNGPGAVMCAFTNPAAALGLGASIQVLSRNSRQYEAATADTSYTLPLNTVGNYGSAHIEVSNAAWTTLDLNGDAPIGSDFYLIIQNTSAGSLGFASLTSDGASVWEGGVETIGVSEKLIFHLKMLHERGETACRWVAVGRVLSA